MAKTKVEYVWITDVESGGESYRCLEVFPTLAEAQAEDTWQGGYSRRSRNKWSHRRLENKTVRHIKSKKLVALAVTIYRLEAR